MIDDTQISNSLEIFNPFFKNSAQMSKPSDTEKLDIDDALEKKAAENNLSVVNVKSILHHILKDTAVLSMAKKMVDECDSGDEMGDVSMPIMTRSRVKQTTGVSTQDKNIIAAASGERMATFGDVEFPSDSSDDEEYHPSPQPIQEDQPSFCTDTDHVISDDEPDVQPTMASTPSATPSSSLTPVQIANRTRSKLPLRDTPLPLLEAALEMPEVMPMGDHQGEVEDEEWQRWLQELFCCDQPTTSVQTNEEEEDDAEYNVLADLHPDEDYEELRNDRAVHISQKEVDSLMEELLRTCDEDNLLMTLPDVDQVMMQQGAVPMMSQDCQLTPDQSATLCRQLQQHFQLLLQTFLLSRYEPSLMFIAQLCNKALNEIIDQCASPGGVIPVWSIPHLEQGKELMNQLDPTTSSHPWVESSRHVIPEPVINILMNNELFWDYPHLLPTTGFTPLSTNSTSELSSQNRVKFTPAEDNLLVLGLDRYENNWQSIIANLLPTKTVKQLQIHVKNLRSSRTADNVVKHYYKTKEVKIPFKDEPTTSVVQLPNWVLTYQQQQKKAVDKANDGSSASPVTSSNKKQRVIAKASHDQHMMETLTSAGLEVTDYTARFSYGYLMEIKSRVDSTVYEELLKVLLDAERNKLTPSEIYFKVSEVLSPWPQLLNIFTDYLDCSEAIKADVLPQKIQIAHAKHFLAKLQERFKSSPLKFDEMLTTLDQPELPLDQLKSQALSLLKDHRDLTRDLNCFLLHICPPPSTPDVYEEIKLLDGCTEKLDEFENITIASGKRKNKTNDTKRAPKGKKKKKTNDEGVR